MSTKVRQYQQCRKHNNNNGNNKYGLKSDIKGMYNHTYDCGYPKISSKFRKSLEELANHVQRTQDYGGYNICALIQFMELLESVVPEADKEN